MDDLTWYLLAWAAITVPGVVLGWLRVFPKAGQPAWAALLPFYNVYVLVVGVARLSALWFVLVWVPVIQIVAAILVSANVADHVQQTAVAEAVRSTDWRTTKK